mmetsp:Transcript_86974/g.243813  ORF Transcript_86974/g.243813 Transcript_86974/m.243813 type:complete len:210 (+) Transcript_86974:2949-3578(+)
MAPMPGVPKGVSPGVNIEMPLKGVAPGVVIEGPDPGIEDVGVAPLGVTSVGVASTAGVADELASTGVSSQRARFRFSLAVPKPGVGVSPHWPGVGVSMPSRSSPPGVSFQLSLLRSSSSSRLMGVSMPSASAGVPHLSASSVFAFFFSASSASSFLPEVLSHRRFFFSAGASSALPSVFFCSSSSFCFWIFFSTSAFSLSSCWLIITSL